VPSHIPLLILAYLPLETLALCFAVSRAWAREALSPELWQRHCEDDGVEVGPGAEHLLERCENDPRGWWREVYRDAVVTRKNWRTANFKIVSAPVVDIRDSINCFWFDTDKLIIGTRRHRLSLFHVPSPAHWTQLSTAATAPPPDICFENAHAVAIMAVAVSPQHVLASVDGAGTLALWNVFTGALIAKLAAAHEGGIAGVAFVDGGKSVVTAGFDKVLRVHELRAGASATAESSATTSSSSTTQRRKSRRGGQPSARDTSAPPTTRASSSLSSSSTSSSLPSSPRISQRFRATLARLRRPPLARENAAGGDAGGASALSSAAGDSGASPITAPEPLSLVCTKALRGHAGDIYCLAVTPSDENVVVTGAMDHTVKVWDLAAGASTRSMRGHTDSITALCVRGDNVFSGSLDKTVRHWDIATGRCTRTLRGHTKWVKTLAMNSRCLLSGGWDEAVFVWDWREGTLLHSLPVGHGPIVCLRFEDDARGVRAVCRGEGWQHHVCVLDFASQPVSALSAATTDASQEAENGDGCGSNNSDCDKPSAEAT
ncbi:WD40-repeat-containing domain protein, partial [Geranomyces variabilis]